MLFQCILEGFFLSLTKYFLGALFERKSINPPPVIQIIVEDNDVHQMWLNERYFFMTSDLYDPNLDQPAVPSSRDNNDYSHTTNSLVIGSTTSSLHKVQENNRG